MRSLAVLSAAWTGSSVQAGDTIYKNDVQDLRDRLHDALIVLGIQTSAYADTPLSGAPNGTSIRAVHIRQLRERTTSGASAGGGGTIGGLQYVLSDLQGSARAMMNNNGVGTSTVIARHDYLPFGEEIGAGIGLRSTGQAYAATDTNRWKYELTERDAVRGLDHTWWRKYENLSGRWTSPDPMKGKAPQTLNAYTYALNDPVNLIDPNGLYAACIHEAMTRHLARITGRSRSVARRLGEFAGDKEGGADSEEYAATTPANWALWQLGMGPAAEIHFASPETIGARVGRFRRDMRSGNYQYAAHTLHAVQDAQPHAGFGRPIGHAHKPKVDWRIGDAKFVKAAQDTFEVLGGRGTLSASQIGNLIKAIIKGCGKNSQLNVVQPPGGGRPSGGSPIGGGPVGGDGGPISPTIFYGGGFGGFDSFRWLDVLLRSGSGGYDEVVAYQIYSH